ncbi:MAG: hypothetical protein ACOZCO_07105 [Bacteroidota bacterium]
MKNFYLLFLILLSCSPSEDEVRLEKVKKKEAVIGIQPFGEIKKEYTEAVKDALVSFYGLKTEIIPAEELPEHCRSPFVKSRYRADSLLNWLHPNVDAKYDFVIGLTDADITATKDKEPAWKYRDWGIFGLGSCPGRTCIVSVFRLGARGADEKLKIERLRKIALHEVGHTFGLPHCPNKGCFMQDAVETIVTVDNEEEQLCEDCRNQLAL